MTSLITAAAVASDISGREARHLAVRAQLGQQNDRTALDVLQRIGLLQLDALRRVDRAHRLTALARMPVATHVESIDGELWLAGQAVAFETWVHAACLVPISDWPLLRLARHKAATRDRRPSEKACREVLAIVADSPAGVTIQELEATGARTAGWEWSERKRAAEHLVWRGQLICSERRRDRRVYDLPERRVPRHHLDQHLTRETILARLATRALRAMGVATIQDVAIYYNLTPPEALEGLTACGAHEITVHEWPTPAWTLPDIEPQSTPMPPRATLIGPFDNLIWDRDRTRRVHDFDYTFEAYKPAAKRQYGHYVMGVLAGGEFLGRIDIHRHGPTLEVRHVFPEQGSSRRRLAAQVRTAAGDLAKHLGVALTEAG